MTVKTAVTGAAIALALPLAANAATISDGVYSVLNYNEPSSSARGVWTPDIVQGAPNLLWDVVGELDISNNGANALMSGIATSLDDSSLKFQFDIEMVGDPAHSTPYCQFSSARDCLGGTVDTSGWDYFDILETNSTFTGLDGMAGLSYTVSDQSSGNHPAQVGINANALSADGDLGLSFWFDFKQIGQLTATNSAGYIFNDSGRGDFNIDLGPTDLAAVPLPAAAWMLLAGIGGLGALGRRKKA